MAGNTQMNDNERGVFSFIHGISGMLVAVVLLLSILGGLSYYGIKVQSDNATKFYEINQDLNSIKFNSPDNHKHRKLVE
jgi:hypothetical protein